MKSNGRRMPTLLMLVLMLGMTGCGSAEKKRKPDRSLTRTDFEVILDEGCKPVAGAPLWTCDEDTYLKIGELGIRLQGRVMELEKDLTHFEKRIELTRDEYEARLAEPWRNPWIVIPCALAVGFLTGGLIFGL